MGEESTIDVIFSLKDINIAEIKGVAYPARKQIRCVNTNKDKQDKFHYKQFFKYLVIVILIYGILAQKNNKNIKYTSHTKLNNMLIIPTLY